ncbi:MAG: hypothetical protein HYV09_17190 [Deltaproteobacteria bacterium]|nr:hypothetical protein [Deltaproteobacteria bacterium]
MYRDLFAGTSVLTFQIIGLVSFLAVFIAVAIRTYSKKAEAYAGTASLPLLDDDSPRPARPADQLARPARPADQLARPARPADTHGGP